MILRETGNLRLAQRLLGHADIKLIMVYAHAIEDDVKAALAALSRNSPGASPKGREMSEGEQSPKGSGTAAS